MAELRSNVGLTAQQTRDLLEQLNDALQIEDAQPVEWVVCGGTALALQGLSTRTTQDVDVLGEWQSTEVGVVPIAEFPSAVSRAIRRVVEAHPELRGFGPRWVNLGARQIVDFGLPDGFATRLTNVRFGDRLALHLLGRVDLISLKLFAASDDLGHREQVHLDDLRTLNPTAAELALSIGWVERLPDPQYRLRASLKNIVGLLGHDDLAYYISV